MNNNFFGSKLNSVLLLILIIIMIVAIKVMLNEKATYLPFLSDDKKEQTQTEPNKEVLGRKEDLVSFSIQTGSKLHGIVSYEGVVKGAYFFEANIGINILDLNKKILKGDHATSTTDWMSSGPVSFAGSIDLSGLPKGPAYFEIHNDNASGLPQNDKSILIPIVIE